MWLIVTKIQFRLGMIIVILKDAIHSPKVIEHVFIINPFNLKIANDVHLSSIWPYLFCYFRPKLASIFVFA